MKASGRTKPRRPVTAGQVPKDGSSGQNGSSSLRNTGIPVAREMLWGAYLPVLRVCLFYVDAFQIGLARYGDFLKPLKFGTFPGRSLV
jgi:hypothetical protein